MSDTPLVQRLQLKKRRTLCIVGAPPGIDGLIEADIKRGSLAEADVILHFVKDRAEFRDQLEPMAARIRPDAILWLAYPKVSSPLATDLNRDTLREAVQAHRLKTVSQIAIDADWSALRLKRMG